MPERVTIATHVLALTGAGLAAFLQLGIILTLGVRLKVAQVVGALIVSGLLGGIATVWLQEVVRWPSFVSGAVGTLTGMLPAALSAGLITRKAFERAGYTPAQMVEMLETLKTQAGSAEEAKKSV